MNISYVRSGDYFIPDLKLLEEPRPIGKWGCMHRDYLKEHQTMAECLLFQNSFRLGAWIMMEILGGEL